MIYPQMDQHAMANPRLSPPLPIRLRTQQTNNLHREFPPPPQLPWVGLVLPSSRSVLTVYGVPGADILSCHYLLGMEFRIEKPRFRMFI